MTTAAMAARSKHLRAALDAARLVHHETAYEQAHIDYAKRHDAAHEKWWTASNAAQTAYDDLIFEVTGDVSLSYSPQCVAEGAQIRYFLVRFAGEEQKAALTVASALEEAAYSELYAEFIEPYLEDSEGDGALD